MSGLSFQEPNVIKALAYKVLLPMQPIANWSKVRVPLRPNSKVRRDDVMAIRNLQVWLLMAAGVPNDQVAHWFSLSVSRCKAIASNCNTKFLERGNNFHRIGAKPQDIALIELRSRQDQMMAAEILLSGTTAGLIVSNHCISVARDTFAVAVADTEGKQCECALCVLLKDGRSLGVHASFVYWPTNEMSEVD